MIIERMPLSFLKLGICQVSYCFGKYHSHLISYISPTFLIFSHLFIRDVPKMPMPSLDRTTLSVGSLGSIRSNQTIHTRGAVTPSSLHGSFRRARHRPALVAPSPRAPRRRRTAPKLRARLPPSPSPPPPLPPSSTPRMSPGWAAGMRRGRVLRRGRRPTHELRAAAALSPPWTPLRPRAWSRMYWLGSVDLVLTK